MNSELIEKIEELKRIVRETVTGGREDYSDLYINLRKELILNEKINLEVPDWLKKNRSLGEVEEFFKRTCSYYDGRRAKIVNDFSDLILRLEFPNNSRKDEKIIKNKLEKKAEEQGIRQYYHIKIETINSDKHYVFEILDENIIYDEYIIPYLRGDEFFIDGSEVRKNKIKKINLIATKENKEEFKIKKGSEVEKKNLLVFNYNVENFIFDYYPNIANSFLIKGKKMIKEKIETKLIENIIKDTNIKNNKVFIVHGHDDGMKIDVARFIESLGLEPIILHEQASKGKTIIEKIDEYTNVRHGIVLYSPCDTGKSNKEEGYKNRARQNVVFEHGYLIGKLGKDKVTALNKGNIETPSDVGGVIYITYDSNEGWKMKMIKELKANGFEIDLSRLF